MIIRIEHTHETFTAEFHNIDPNLEQIFEAFKGMLVAGGWHPMTIDRHIIELAEELNPDTNEPC